MAGVANAVAGLASMAVDDSEANYIDLVGSSFHGQPTWRKTPPLEDISPNGFHPRGNLSGEEHRMTELGGQKYHTCLQCILKVPGLTKKRTLLRLYFSNKQLLLGAGDYQPWQRLTVTFICNLLFKFDLHARESLLNEFKDVTQLKVFLVENGLVAFIMHVMNLHKPAEPPSSKVDYTDPMWPIAACYCITVIFGLANYEDEMSKGTGSREQLMGTHKVTDEIVRAGVIKLLVRFAGRTHGGPYHGMVEAMEACAALRALAFTCGQAGHAIMCEAGLPLLGRLFSPGQFERSVAELRDTNGFKASSRMLLYASFDNTVPQIPKHNLTAEEAYQTALKHGPSMTEDAGATIAYLLETCKEARSSLLSEPCNIALQSALEWLNMPLQWQPGGQLCALRAVCVFRQLLNSSASVINSLIQKHNLLDVLENWLYPATGVPMADILYCYLLIARTGGVPRELLSTRWSTMEPIALLGYCSLPTVQENALKVMVAMVPHHKQLVTHLLQRHLIGPDMFKRTPRCFAPCIGLLDKLQRACLRAAPSHWKVQDAAIVGKFVGSPSTVSSLQGRSRDELKEMGKTQFADGNYQLAAVYYSAAILVAGDRPAVSDDTDAILYGNRSECYLRLKHHDDAIRDATLALGRHLQETPCAQFAVKCAFRRAKAFYAQGLHFQALSDAAVCCYSTKEGNSAFEELRTNITTAMERERSKSSSSSSAAASSSSSKGRQRVCDGCGVVGAGMRKCSRCEKAYFCGKACLRENWPVHQQQCQK